MNEQIKKKEQTKNFVLPTVISFVCLFAADIQFLLSLKLVFIDQEFATLGLSLVLFLVFLLAFFLVAQKVCFCRKHFIVALTGASQIAIIGGLLIGLLGGLIAYAVLIGAFAFLFGAIAFYIATLIQHLFNDDDIESRRDNGHSL